MPARSGIATPGRCRSKRLKRDENSTRHDSARKALARAIWQMEQEHQFETTLSSNNSNEWVAVAIESVAFTLDPICGRRRLPGTFLRTCSANDGSTVANGSSTGHVSTNRVVRRRGLQPTKKGQFITAITPSSPSPGRARDDSKSRPLAPKQLSVGYRRSRTCILTPAARVRPSPQPGLKRKNSAEATDTETTAFEEKPNLLHWRNAAPRCSA